MTLLVTGADGMLGSAVVRAAQEVGELVVPLGTQDCDIGDGAQVMAVVDRYPGAAMINCAGIVRERVDVDPIRSAWINGVGPHILAFYAKRVLQVSTDCVFDGALQEGAYLEDSPPCPLDQYGRSKLFGELRAVPHLTVRVSFVGLGQRGLIHWLLSQPAGVEVPGYINWYWNGWTASALARHLVTMALDPTVTGLLHLPGPEVVTKGWLLQQVAFRLRPDLKIVGTETPQALRMVLGSREKFLGQPSWYKMLEELAEEFRAIEPQVGSTR